MYPHPFDYVRAEGLDHALEVLESHGPDAMPLAGGQSLLPVMKLRLVAPRVVVDISRLDELAYVREGDGRLLVGALTRHGDLVERDWQPGLAILRDASGTIGDVQVRNAGTIGGALAHADPGGNWGPALQALDAAVRIVSRTGERVVPVAELFSGAYSTVLEPGELITEVGLPLPGGRTTGAYLKLARGVGDFAVASVAVQLSWREDGACERAGVGVGGVGPTPVKATEAESFLRGKTLDQTTIDEASRLVQEAASPMSDHRASEEYRREMMGVLFRRAAQVALRRRSGEAVEAGYV